MGIATDNAMENMRSQTERFARLVETFQPAIDSVIDNAMNEMFGDWYRWCDFIQDQWIDASVPFDGNENKERTPFDSPMRLEIKLW